MDMPGYLDYGKIMQMNPFAAYQANQQMDLAKQFQDQKYQQEQNTTNKGTLENIFSAQNNPNKVQQQILQNEGLGLSNENMGYKNRTDKLGAERAEANQQNILSADQRAAALKMSEDDMKAFDFHVGELLRNPDAAQRAEGAKLQTYLSSYQAERRKAADELSKAGEASRIHAGSAERIANANIEAGRWDKAPKGGSSLSFSAQLAKMKAADMLPHLSKALETNIDPDTGQEMTPVARLGYEAMFNQAGTQTDSAIASRANAGSLVLSKENGKTDLAPKKVPSSVYKKPELSEDELIKLYSKPQNK